MAGLGLPLQLWILTVRRAVLIAGSQSLLSEDICVILASRKAAYHDSFSQGVVWACQSLVTALPGTFSCWHFLPFLLLPWREWCGLGSVPKGKGWNWACVTDGNWAVKLTLTLHNHFTTQELLLTPLVTWFPRVCPWRQEGEKPYSQNPFEEHKLNSSSELVSRGMSVEEARTPH